MLARRFRAILICAAFGLAALGSAGCGCVAEGGRCVAPTAAPSAPTAPAAFPTRVSDAEPGA